VSLGKVNNAVNGRPLLLTPKTVDTSDAIHEGSRSFDVTFKLFLDSIFQSINYI